MISRLRGLLLEKSPPILVIDVQGVGYEVEAPMSTFYKLPDLNQSVSLFTHLLIREDAHHLVGFISDAERRMFRELIRVNGVGAKLALGILSAMELGTFASSIQQGNTAQLIKIPGVGKKTAERLVIEMRDRLTTFITDAPNHSATSSASSALVQGLISPVDDAISALIALGYKPQEATRWVQAVTSESTEKISSEILIKRALQAALKQ
ncbi:Holliday junction DNA helicase, RuvA subunit [Beggiatoa alba B18LD]|uniref:Holliday junction branch migration complex subunit RuvA n=1 Tax=Beggiatoa alba B18LD TaxID=395493 RepID=I3CKF2_9GAMM|nr:Holliday junction branch migration protein RuvA [Beggiatoa alba]EIJ44095.1 Holliday junction DNA helicase, RuvA subunit [Beggiatoa alba B18LD]